MTRVRAAIVIVIVALVLLGIGGVVGRRPSTPAAVDAPVTVDRLGAQITRTQQRLAAVPGDHDSWAALGVAYLEKARITADPAFYPKAEGALRKSLELRPDGNAGAQTGLGALAGARHEFAQARDRALLALQANGFDADAYAVLADAYTQLGQPDAATDAIQHMLDLRPGLPAYARASYDLEQHGRIDEARTILTRALESSIDPADIAFCHLHLGELSWHAGSLDAAGRSYAAAAANGYPPAQEGLARVAAAAGRTEEALAGYADLTRRAPTPSNLLAYADLLRVAGRTEGAMAQVALADAAHRLFLANGGSDNLAGAALAIAQSRPADALRLAEQEWQRRQHTDVADLMAWTLHLAGRDAEALPYAVRATALGARNATYAYHLGVVSRSVGDTAAARDQLARALDINPYFSPLDAPLAARALAELGE